MRTTGTPTGHDACHDREHLSEEDEGRLQNFSIRASKIFLLARHAEQGGLNFFYCSEGLLGRANIEKVTPAIL